MRRRAVWFWIWALLALPVGAAAEVIETFTASIDVQPNGSFVVTEEIVYDFADASRHGIFRTVPLTHPQAADVWYKVRVIDVTVTGVARNDAAEPYELSSSGNEYTVRIGDPDVTISGSQTYNITYQVAGGLTYYEDGSIDLYWNTTGDNWEVPIRGSTAIVSGPDNALLEANDCFVGIAGATERCRDIATSSRLVTFTAAELSPGEGFTIAQALNPAIIDRQVLEEWNLWWLWLSLGVVWLIGVGRLAYRHYTYHDPDETVVVQYEPYPDVKPMFAGLLIDGQLHSRDITAGLLYLAEQGFLTIRKTERTVLWLFATNDYELDLLRDPAETDTHFQATVLALLFGRDASVGATVALSALQQNKTRQRQNQRVLRTLKSDLQQDLIDRGFYETTLQQLIRPLGVALASGLGVVALAVATGLAEAVLFTVATAAAVASGIGLVVVATRRTKKGHRARNQLQGFKQFLSVTGRDRFAFHDAPERSPTQFSQYLPYAVAFGVETEWAEVFADIVIPQPRWYQDGTGTSTFAASALVSDLDSFSTSFAQGTGTSASSGGGSAGGGAGGGGGGSW